MYNFDAFEQARQQYLTSQMPFIESHREKVAIEKPYRGLKILHNVPLTLATVFKIEVLALGGAEVVATTITNLPPEKRAIEILEQANVVVKIEHQFNQRFDLHLDCCAELLHQAPPRLGAVELTQTGSNLYKDANCSYPVVSVDDSSLKVLETFFGTGDGFCRAMYQYAGDDMLNKPFVVFGYGKVGRGIVCALQKFTNDITIIDVASAPSSQGTSLKYVAANDLDRVKKTISNAYCTITATGINGMITNAYGLDKSDFGACLLSNMGAEDEYGHNFESEDVLFEKRPFNFSLELPTALHYLDPVFYAHTFGTDLILSQIVSVGYNPFPSEIAKDILNHWQSLYKENVNDALSLMDLPIENVTP